MGRALFCLALRLGLKHFREEFKREGVEAFAYMDDVSLDLTEITVNTFAFLRRSRQLVGVI